MKRASPPRPQDDQRILQSLARGETAPMGDLYDRYSGLVFSLVLRVIKDQALAEDLLQEVFLRVWRSAEKYRPELGSVKSWLSVIAHHCAIDEWRRRQKENAWIDIESEEIDVRFSTEDELSDPFIAGALRVLPGNQRQIVELAYYHGWTIDQIARQLDLPPGTVKSRIRLAMDKLRIACRVQEENEAWIDTDE
jgi:RNA polymerase sigma-70 factor (ECF subfamily)